MYVVQSSVIRDKVREIKKQRETEVDGELEHAYSTVQIQILEDILGSEQHVEVMSPC